MNDSSYYFTERKGWGAEGAYKLVKCYFSELEVSSVNRETTIEKP